YRLTSQEALFPWILALSLATGIAAAQSSEKLGCVSDRRHEERPGRGHRDDRPVDQGQPARGAQGAGSPVQGAVRLPGTDGLAPGEDRAADGGSRDRNTALPGGRGTR